MTVQERRDSSEVGPCARGCHADGGASAFLFFSPLTTMGQMGGLFVTMSAWNTAGSTVSQKGVTESMLIWWAFLMVSPGQT